MLQIGDGLSVAFLGEDWFVGLEVSSQTNTFTVLVDTGRGYSDFSPNGLDYDGFTTFVVFFVRDLAHLGVELSKFGERK